MIDQNPVVITLLLVMLALATFTDLRERRIKNVLTFPMMGVGIALGGLFGGIDGLKEHALGAVLGLGMLFPLFMLRWMGAGDVKLMGAIGALMGIDFVWFACLWSAVFGGAFALAGFVYTRRLGLALAYLYYSGLRPQGGSFLSSNWRMPYAPAIALGSLVVLGGVTWLNWGALPWFGGF
jgi:prepilin peptidase CpaA